MPAEQLQARGVKQSCSSAASRHGKSAARARRAKAHLGARGTFEGFPTDLAEVGPPLLVPAGDVPQEGPLLREPLVAELTAKGALPCVGPVVLVQARCREQGKRELEVSSPLGVPVRAQAQATLW